MSKSATKLYEFGAFRLDAAERVLWRGEEMIALPPKVFDTLWTLVKEEGRIVSKADFMEAIWADAAVEESNLSQNIYTLRRALGVDEQGRRFIETIPRRGYRFAAPVRLLGEASNNVVNDDRVLETLPPPPLSTSWQAEKALPTRPTLRNGLSAGLGVVILFALGFGVYQLVHRRGEKDRIAPIEQVRFKRLTDSGDVISPTISHDGKWMAYVREEKQGSVWIKHLESGSESQTLPPSSKSYRSLAFSPDGRLFFHEGQNPGAIYRTPAFGGEPEKIVDDVWSDFSVSPDGKRLAFIRRDVDRGSQSLILSEVDGGAERVLGTKLPPMEYGAGAPAWSPDGSKLVVAAGLEQRHFLIVDASTGEEREWRTGRWRAITNALWTPDGENLIFSARATDESISQLWMLGYPDGPLRRLTNDLESYFWISISADGRKLVTRQQRIASHLWLLPDGDPNKARQLTLGERGFDGRAGLAWAPDGRIVFSASVNGVTDLYSMNHDGKDRRQLTANAGQDNIQAVVTSDGRYIVFTSNRTGSRQIWRADVDGRNQKQLTFGGEQNDSAQYAAVSNDGREVFFIKRGAGPAAIWKVSIEGGNSVPGSRMTGAAAEGFPTISPDGKWLAYQRVSAGQNLGEENMLRIGALPTAGDEEPRLFDLPARNPIIRWSADSAAFDYAAGGLFNSSSLWRQPISGGEPQKLCDFTDHVFNFAWSRDGKNLAVSAGKQQGDALLITNLP
ncbi:MAG: PD40 domain-containing protein [Chloracidobacterium sp.]|nr:PD40 domain-containing protein [Chloracidobacterium sp.]